MIINCDKCNKNFDIKDDLIPEKGRLVKCSNCNNIWFFTPNDENNSIPSVLENNVKKDEFESKEKEILENKNINKIQISDNIKPEENNNKEELIKKSNKKDLLKIYFNYLFIIIFSFVGLILIIDTFKLTISNYIPGVLPFLDNLYESLSDLILFIKDLFN